MSWKRMDKNGYFFYMRNMRRNWQEMISLKMEEYTQEETYTIK